MTNKLAFVSVVILAKAHNPSILSPDWLKRNEVITEKPKQFALTPDFALFDSKNFNLIVDRQRFQLNVKAMTPKKIDSLVTITKKYIELLPHIPYLRLGINFDWIVEAGDTNTLPKITTSIGSLDDFTHLFPKHERCYGMIIVANEKDYRLRLNIEPTDENSLIYKFNFDYLIEDLEIGKVINFVNSLPELLKYTLEIVDKTSK